MCGTGTCRGPARCDRKPNAIEKMEIECTWCDGDPKGCDHCHYGRMEITQCPMELITPDIVGLLEDTELFYRGLAPVAGGVLAQSARFIEAARFVRATQNEVINEIQGKNG